MPGTIARAYNRAATSFFLIAEGFSTMPYLTFVMRIHIMSLILCVNVGNSSAHVHVHYKFHAVPIQGLV